MTNVANPTLGKVEDLFKAIFWDNFIKGALIALKIDFWPINTIVYMITDKAFDLARTKLDLNVIKFLNVAAQKEFEREAVKLATLERDFGTDSDAYQKALEEAHEDFAKFTRFRGA